ncbi:MAG TPA: hypothetical protein VGE88_06505 [Lysobacter sp.]
MALVVGLWLVVVAINWRDEAPSADARRLQRVIDGRPAVADAANAYVLLLGMGVSKEDDPFAWGVKRRAYLDSFPAGVAVGGPAVLPGTDREDAGHRSESTKRLLDACREADHGCWAHLQQHPEQIDDWLDSESWRLDRYVGLIGLTQWRESIPTDLRAPLPAYSPAMDGQRMLLMKAWRHASLGEAAAARDLLQRDLTFWRMVLRSSDILISKMIANAAIQRHFAMGNLVFRKLGEVGADTLPPSSWEMPIDRGERSMLRAFAGEWRFSKSAVEASLNDEALTTAQFGNRIYSWAFLPLFKPEATNNLQAANMVRLIDGMDVGMTEVPGAVEALGHAQRSGLPSLYNPVGDILGRVAYPAYIPYASRVSDLEGARRAALLAIELRNDRPRCSATELEARIANSPLKEPYDGAPFAWDAVTGSIVFQGLEPAPRGRRAVLL